MIVGSIREERGGVYNWQAIMNDAAPLEDGNFFSLRQLDSERNVNPINFFKIGNLVWVFCLTYNQISFFFNPSITPCRESVWHCMLWLEEHRTSLEGYGDSQHRYHSADFMCEGCVTRHEYKRPSEIHWKYTGLIWCCQLVTAPRKHVFNENACLVTMATPLCSDSKWLYVNLEIWSGRMNLEHWTASIRGQTKKKKNLWHILKIQTEDWMKIVKFTKGVRIAANQSTSEHD